MKGNPVSTFPPYYPFHIGKVIQIWLARLIRWNLGSSHIALTAVPSKTEHRILYPFSAFWTLLLEWALKIRLHKYFKCPQQTVFLYHLNSFLVFFFKNIFLTEKFNKVMGIQSNTIPDFLQVWASYRFDSMNHVLKLIHNIQFTKQKCISTLVITAWYLL